MDEQTQSDQAQVAGMENAIVEAAGSPAPEFTSWGAAAPAPEVSNDPVSEAPANPEPVSAEAIQGSVGSGAIAPSADPVPSAVAESPVMESTTFIGDELDAMINRAKSAYNGFLDYSAHVAAIHEIDNVVKSASQSTRDWLAKHLNLEA
jgi:hypothetical protein